MNSIVPPDALAFRNCLTEAKVALEKDEPWKARAKAIQAWAVILFNTPAYLLAAVSQAGAELSSFRLKQAAICLFTQLKGALASLALTIAGIAYTLLICIYPSVFLNLISVEKPEDPPSPHLRADPPPSQSDPDSGQQELAHIRGEMVRLENTHEGEIEKKEREIADLKEQVERIATLEEKLKATEIELGLLKQEKLDLDDLYSQEARQHADLKERHQATSAMLQKKTQQASQLSRQQAPPGLSAQKKSTKQQLLDKIEELTKAIRDLTKERDELKISLKDTGKVKKLEKTIEAQKEEIKRLKEENTQLKKS